MTLGTGVSRNSGELAAPDCNKARWSSPRGVGTTGLSSVLTAAFLLFPRRRECPISDIGASVVALTVERWPGEGEVCKCWFGWMGKDVRQDLRDRGGQDGERRAVNRTLNDALPLGS